MSGWVALPASSAVDLPFVARGNPVRRRARPFQHVDGAIKIT